MTEIKKAATQESNGNHRHKDTKNFQWKEPPLNFTGTGQYKGLIFTRIIRREQAYCYLVIAGGAKYYHVFRRRENHFWGTISYPRPEVFGYWAWCFNSLVDATKKLNEISHG